MSYIIAALFCLLLIFFGNMPLFATVYALAAAYLIIRLFISSLDMKSKIYLFIVYGMILALQEIYNSWILFEFDFDKRPSLLMLAIGIFILLVPFFLEKILLNNNHTKAYFPSVKNITAMTFTEVRRNRDNVLDAVDSIKKMKKSASRDNIREILEDLPNHSSTRYVNQDNLTEEYFLEAEKSLNDPHLYIIISRTGSAASELISVFTSKSYNHASLSFDRDLKTIISYNGGERVYPPGLNAEMIEFFNKKEDSSIIVYRLACPKEKKKLLIDRIREINREGSAYNILGLILRFSFKPNIMFCSQFVYKMLKTAGLNYFEKKEGHVKPTDFAELDYYRKLEFDYEISFRNKKKPG
jgi:hypothetical protein